MRWPEIAHDPARHRIVLVHIRKTAGTSLGQMLGGAFGDPLGEMIEAGTHARADRGVLRLHRQARFALLAMRRRWRIRALQRAGRPAHLAHDAPFIAGHFVLGAEPGCDRAPLYVTLVREPVDRLVSDYWFMRGKRDRSRGDALDPALYDQPLAAFADALIRDPHLYRDNLQCRTLAGTAEPGEAVRRARERLWLAAATDQFTGLAGALGRAIGRDLGPVRQAKRNARRPAGTGLDPARTEALAALNAGDAALVAALRADFAAVEAETSARGEGGGS